MIWQAYFTLITTGLRKQDLWRMEFLNMATDLKSKMLGMYDEIQGQESWRLVPDVKSHANDCLVRNLRLLGEGLGPELHEKPGTNQLPNIHADLQRLSSPLEYVHRCSRSFGRMGHRVFILLSTDRLHREGQLHGFVCMGCSPQQVPRPHRNLLFFGQKKIQSSLRSPCVPPFYHANQCVVCLEIPSWRTWNVCRFRQ